MENPQTTLNVSLMARAFHRRIREVLATDELASVDQVNRVFDGDLCATHDHVDANVYMAEAFEEVMRREPDCDSEDDTTPWNMAWGLAKCEGFSNHWDDRPRPG